MHAYICSYVTSAGVGRTASASMDWTQAAAGGGAAGRVSRVAVICERWRVPAHGGTVCGGTRLAAVLVLR